MEQIAQEQKEKLNSRFFLKSVVLTIAILIILIFVFGINIYVFGLEGKITKIISEILPFPVASVNSRFVFMSDFLEVKEALKKADSALASKNLISGEQAQKNLDDLNANVLRGLVRNKLIENLLKEKGARVIDKEVDTETEKVLSQVKNPDDIKNKIKELYGWDIELYKKYVIKPEMERLKLEKVLGNELKDKSFDEFMLEKFKNANVKIFLRGYKWNKDTLAVVKK